MLTRLVFWYHDRGIVSPDPRVEKLLDELEEVLMEEKSLLDRLELLNFLLAECEDLTEEEVEDIISIFDLVSGIEIDILDVLFDL